MKQSGALPLCMLNRWRRVDQSFPRPRERNVNLSLCLTPNLYDSIPIHPNSVMAHFIKQLRLMPFRRMKMHAHSQSWSSKIPIENGVRKQASSRLRL